MILTNIFYKLFMVHLKINATFNYTKNVVVSISKIEFTLDQWPM